MRIGRRIYYELATGNVIVDTGEKIGNVVESTVEQDFKLYKRLSERLPASVGVIELVYGAYQDDFRECSGYRVNLETMKLEFAYSVEQDEESFEQMVYRKPISIEVDELKQLVSDLASLQLGV